MDVNVLVYHTSLTPEECIGRIMHQPWEYECEWGTALWYDVVMISDSHLRITFKGGQFRKAMRTRYLVDFVQHESATKIVLQFEKDLFGLPAMTPPADIDLFMGQKVNAVRETTEPPKSSKPSRFMTALCIWLGLILVGFVIFVVCFSTEGKHTETTNISDYGVYTGTNDDAFTQNFINAFFPAQIDPSMEVVKYSYRAENVDTYGFEAYLEVHIDDPAVFESYIQSIAPAEKWVQFSFSEEYMEYPIENVLDISLRSTGDRALRSNHPIECARIRKILYSPQSQTVIFVALGVYDGGGVGTDYLCAFFDRFDIDPVAYEKTADSPYAAVSP